MKKEEILEKARRENKDEREEQVTIRANKIGWMSVSVVAIFLIVWRDIHNESASDIVMIIMVQFIAASSYRYVKMPEKKVLLVCIITGIIAFGLSFASLLSQYGVF
ncbi:MAG TPA: hypothetical protein GXZ90_05335 [Clostridiales bacterium]|nr:hypothetical protein [Clostridiales bacterium]